MPAAGRPAAWAAVPVPPSTTLRSTEVVVSAASRLTACRVFLAGRSSSVPSLLILATSVWARCLPWSARVA